MEGLLLTLQDEGRCFTTLPKLALQKWGDSDIQEPGRVHGLARWYATAYHAVFPEALYHGWEEQDEAGADGCTAAAQAAGPAS